MINNGIIGALRFRVIHLMSIHVDIKAQKTDTDTQRT